MRTGSFLLIIIFIASACSPSKQLRRSANSLLLKDSALRSAHVGISIYDAGSGKYLYDHQGDKYFIPASNTKIPTSFAAMKYLGDSIVGMKYREEGSTVRIEMTGDPGFLHPDFSQQPAYGFLKRFSEVVIHDPKPFTEHLGNGWSWNNYKESYMAQRSSFPIYGNVVKFHWTNGSLSAVPSYFLSESVISNQLPAGFQVSKPWDRNTFIIDSGNRKSLEVPFRPDQETIRSLLEDTLKTKVAFASGPLSSTSSLYSWHTDSLLKPMMHRSDNFFAEQCLLMVSEKRLGTMNVSGVIDLLLQNDLSDLPQKPRWVDGSGLSRYNLFSPADFVMILNKMREAFGMERIREIFPTGGEGTLENYYTNIPGFIHAKTGTLSDVVALSGFLITRKNRLLIFSMLVNNHQSTATAVRKAFEKFIIDLRNRY